MHTKKYITAGKPLSKTGKALILLHGRGGSAEDILSLGDSLPVEDFSLFAPVAAAHSWYPYSFLSLPAQNEPWLSSALDRVFELVEDIKAQGVPAGKIWFTGFSQGACLMLEFITRHATRYGGAAAFTGGLIGDKLYPENYKGDFGGTPVFIGTSDPDPHVPVERVRESGGVLEEMGAEVTVKVYKGMGHTINGQEIAEASKIVFGK
jgi:phospholipase/carboxylesterase